MTAALSADAYAPPDAQSTCPAASELLRRFNTQSAPKNRIWDFCRISIAPSIYVSDTPSKKSSMYDRASCWCAEVSELRRSRFMKTPFVQRKLEITAGTFVDSSASPT